MRQRERGDTLNETDAIVLGLGEIGRPLRSVLGRAWRVAGLDVHHDPEIDRADFIHACYPFQIDDFVETTVAYIERFRPKYTVIHSTIAPGTTQAIRDASPTSPVYYSPVRGKHVTMEKHLLSYSKFLSGPDDGMDLTRKHFEAAGMTVERMEPTEALETAKLLETTYFGVLIAWAQEAERFANAVGADHATVKRFIEEVAFLPSDVFPGHIGGHCVMPNIKLLATVRPSEILDFVEHSNQSFEDEGVDR